MMIKSDYKKTAIRVIYAWILLLTTLLLILLNIFFLNNFIEKERTYKDNQLNLIAFTYRTELVSNNLANSLLYFSLTFDPRSLEAYWTQYEKIRNIDAYLIYLKKLSSTDEEIQLLLQAKEHADKLRESEVKAIKLILTAREVNTEPLPKEISSLTLTDEEKKLTNQQKIDLAYSLIGSEDYIDTKQRVLALVHKAREDIIARTHQNIEKEERRVDYLFMSLTCLTVFALLIVITIIWLRALSIKKWAQ